LIVWLPVTLKLALSDNFERRLFRDNTDNESNLWAYGHRGWFRTSCDCRASGCVARVERAHVPVVESGSTGWLPLSKEWEGRRLRAPQK